jgi:hypothetical protein
MILNKNRRLGSMTGLAGLGVTKPAGEASMVSIRLD